MPVILVVILLLALATLGFCGSDCQDDMFGYIRDTKRGIEETQEVILEPVPPVDAGVNDEMEL